MQGATESDKFRDSVIRETPGGELLLRCIQCGACSGSCPNGADMDGTPRHVLALVNAGLRDAALSHDTMWNCVSCYLCTTRCPQQIPITDVMATLKRMSASAGLARDEDARALAQVFTSMIERYGRSFELGLASRFYLTRKPTSAVRLGPLGLSLFRHGRMSLRPKRIRRIEELRSIIRRARELGGAP